jgi:acetyltransferase-like isoleucine patch superfamily enzyme
MREYRQLTQEEIGVLESNSCWAENWEQVQVAEAFSPYGFHRVVFYGDIRLGVFEKQVEVTNGFTKHAGINDATLRNVTVGDNCLIEKIGNFINNYTIGDDCYISNICTMETTEGATFGEGHLVSVLNEMGDGNVMLFHDLNSQLAAFMVKHFKDRQLKDCIMRLVNEEIRFTQPEQGTIGNGVKIINTKEITNTVVKDDCEISGASRLSDCTILSSKDASVYIGTGVICENSIISNGCSITNSVKMQDCFVGEACQITNGFTAEASVFFANSYMANGEACAAFCGPFSASHHKSSLLIGGEFSFYNAGSNTNFSNHAYKMGPMHYGTLERGSKTASGAYVLMPANIGAFSVCFGKLMNHPDMRCLPFAYLMAYGETMYIVPGRNITTVGLYRDIKKWPKRDKRAASCRKSVINFDWLSPFTVGEIVEGKKILESLQRAGGKNVSSYNFQEYIINASSLKKGIKYYDIALRIYMGAVLKRAVKEGFLGKPTSDTGLGKWIDLSGLLLPISEEERLIEDIKNGNVESIRDVLNRFYDINDHYREYQWAWTYQLMLDYYGLDELTDQAMQRIREDYVRARRAWIAEIRKDAQKEFAMGDVEQEVFDDFISKLDHEVDYED